VIEITRKVFVRLLAIAALGMMMGGGAHAAGKTSRTAIHKVAVHVNQNDKAIMNMALNNVQNLINHYKKAGEKVVVEVVAYGPGLHMYRADTSPVKDRIAAMSLRNKNVKFSACGNTHRKMSKAAGKQVALVSEARKVPSGVVRLVELQEHGYAYVRP